MNMRMAAVLVQVQVLIAVVISGEVLAAVPDLSGPWQHRGSQSALLTDSRSPPPLLAAAQAAYAANQEARRRDALADPMAECLPPGVPRLMMQPFPFNIVQGRRTIAMMFQWNHLTRLIYLDQPHFRSIGPLYLGQSIGHWEGDVLVIETNSFNDSTWLHDSGIPHSRSLHTVERLRLIRGGSQLENRITIEDAETFASSWTTTLLFDRKPGVLIEEDYCLGRTGRIRFAVH
jgi:hypothetical protein